MDGIHIVEDKEPVRILGAWIGNNVDQSAIWSPVIDKIRNSLDQWSKSHPTLFGRRLIVQMIVGGMSQYLATTQGMPKQVVQILEKITHKFIWDESKPSVSMETLYLPIAQGGIKLLDLASQNKAIEIMWLKSYLTLSHKHPVWAYITDVLIGESITKDSGAVSSLAQMNVYLQTWRPGLHPGSTLPKSIKTMLKVGKDFNLSFTSLKLSDSLKKKLPAWYHIGINHQFSGRLNNTPTSKCLREEHKIKTIGDLIQNVRRCRGQTGTQRHLDHTNCACCYCKNDRLSYGCAAPNKCHKMAIQLLEQIQPKWHPNNQSPHDGLTHTQNRRQVNINARRDNKEILFDPSLTSDDDLSHNFRIFTEKNSSCVDPAYRKQRPVNLPEEEITVFTVGSCLENGTEEARAGSGVWYGPEHVDNVSLRIPGENQSNQVAELVAILHALKKAAPFAALHINSDSRYVVDGLTKNLTMWEKCGWIGATNKDFFKAIASHLRQRGAVTFLKWVKGHATGLGNKEANKLALEGAQKPPLTLWIYPSTRSLTLQGLNYPVCHRLLHIEVFVNLKHAPPGVPQW
jgi:ribonuclease HI